MKLAKLPRRPALPRRNADERWASAGIEPNLDELLADPLVHLIMRRDRVTPKDVLAATAAIRRRDSRPAHS